MFRWCFLALLALLAGAAHSHAFEQAADRALRISLPQEVAAPAPRTLDRQVSALHTVRIGSDSATLRVRYGHTDMIDGDAFAAAQRSKLRRTTGGLQYDRPDTGERVSINVATGEVYVDGVRSYNIGPGEIILSDRTWLSVDLLEVLTGQAVSVPGRERMAHADRQKPSPARSAPLLMPQASGEANARGGRLQLTAASSSERAALSGRTGTPLSIPAARHSNFEGVYGASLDKPRTASLPTDWRGRASWRIEPQAPPDPPGADEGPGLRHAVLETGEPDRASKQPQAVSQKTNKAAGNAPHLHLVAARSDQAPRARHPARAGSQHLPEVRTRSAADQKVPDAQESAVNRQVLPAAQGAVRGVLMLETAGITGRGGEGQPLEGEVVSLINLATTETLTVRSATFGAFAFEGLKPGLYRLRAMAGWQEIVSVVRIGDQAVRLTLAMPLGDPSPDAARAPPAPQPEKPGSVVAAGLSERVIPEGAILRLRPEALRG